MNKYFVVLLLAFLSSITSQAQKFYNLTANDVKIDSVLPTFVGTRHIGYAYADSVYNVSIEYPEFIDMSRDDVAKLKKLGKESLPAMPEIKQFVTVERKQGQLVARFCPLVLRNGRYQKLVSFMLRITSTPKNRGLLKAKAASAPSDRYAAHSVLAKGTWAKIRVPATGVYQLTNEVVRRAGFSDPSKVKIYGYGGALQPEQIDGDYLKETDDLKEVPTCTVNGRRLFHAQGPVTWNKSGTTYVRQRNYFSDYGYYFLTESEGAPLTVDSASFVSSFYPSPDYFCSLYEEDKFAWFEGGRKLFDSHAIGLGGEYTFSVPSNGTGKTGRMQIVLSFNGKSTAEIYVNDSLVGRAVNSSSLSEYEKARLSTMNFTINNLLPTNKVRVKNTEGSIIHLDYIQIVQPEANKLPAPLLSTAAFAAPEYVYNITNQDHHADSPADMIILIPTSQKLLAQARRLADYHTQHDALRVRIVPADELYNEFSSGTPDINAYRRYLKMLYDRAETDADMPKYFLLFGDCAWDNRMHTSVWKGYSPDDFLLCYESENSYHEVNCFVDDGFIALLDDGEGGSDYFRQDKLDLAFGRFPVRTEAEAKIMVDKTLAYKANANAGAWQNILMFMGDDGYDTEGNVHMKDVNDAATQVETDHPGFYVRRVMWDAYKRVASSTGYTYPTVANVIKQQQAAGALVFDYSGHGKPDQISHERVLELADFDNFKNTNLPLWVTASCDIMPFDGATANIGESAVLNANGGAFAFFGTTRTVYVHYNRFMNMAFIRHVTNSPNGRANTLGEAQTLAKNEMITGKQDLSENKLQYSLLGDPAMSLNLPNASLVIDSIGDVNVAGGQTAELKAGAIVTVKGYVADAATGVVKTDFHGLFTAMVRDNKELVTCRKNDTRLKEAFQFYDRSKILFNGSDSVRNGRFQFTFAVPQDINYSGESGLINLYAASNDRKTIANGWNDKFTVGGSVVVSNDSIGPSVYCYLNSPSFVNGGDVNTTPYFVAQITDKDGINAAGNGIGHDLTLTIDGDMQKTYNLNDNFTFDFGSYTKGATWYSIPQLAPGSHKLKFTAWDILNNVSTTELRFNVVEGLTPNVVNVNSSNNPAVSSTTFILTHDRTGNAMDVLIEVFDMSGRKLWQHQDNNVVANTDVYTYDWDLCADGGARLRPGVYLYRATIACDGSTKTSKAKKLVIVDNN